MSKKLQSQLTLAATLIMFVLTAVLITRNEEFIFRDEGRLTAEVDPNDPGTVVFYWRSEVEVPMARRFEEAFAEWEYRADRIIIDLHSPGGAVREGEEVIRVVERMKRTHIVDTRVRNRRACYSMCVPIFLMGEERVAAPNARFMFHEPTAYDFFTGEPVREPEYEKRNAADRFFNRYFVNSPMDPAWGDKLRAQWRGKDIWKSGQSLVDERSNIITRLER